MESKRWGHRIRLMMVWFVSIAAFGALGVRLYLIQHRNGEKDMKRGTRQHYGLIKLSPQRGRIFDRQMNALALNSSRPSLRIKPDDWIQSKVSVSLLAGALGLPYADLNSRIERILTRWKKSSRPSRSFVLSYSVDKRRQDAVQQLELDGLFFSEGTGRVYPCGSLASSTLGIVGLEGAGLEGIELYSESDLRGSVGSIPTIRDGRGANLFYTDVTKLRSTRGSDVILALDQYVQYLAERELKEIAEKYSPKWASIVVMEPYLGQVLAVANWPNFNPNRLEFSSPEQRKNYAIIEGFEPGSTIKPFTIAAALENRIVTPQTPVDCENGRYRVHRHTIRDDIHAYDWLTVEEVVAHSSNIGVVKIAQEVGEQKLYQMLRGLGFGSGTGVTFPGESEGLLRPVSRWSGLSIAAIPYGQEMQTTVLGLTTAYCAIANGGYRINPQLILGYRNPRTGKVEPVKYSSPQRVFSEQTADQLTSMLVAVTEWGTGKNARVKGYKAAGKTGTAQIYDPQIGRYSRERHVASFAGFLPAENPRVVIAVVVNEPREAKYGNVVAAPAFSSLGESLMHYFSVFPTKQETRTRLARELFEEVQRNPAHSALAMAGGKDSSGNLVIGMTMREAYEHLRENGEELKFHGSGLALIQQLEKETPEKEGVIRVQFFQPGRFGLN